MFNSLLIYIIGLIVGLGAVTVIDLHGFLGRKSKYWTLATTRTHKVTKPLIWIGTILSIVGRTISYSAVDIKLMYLHISIFSVLILNGLFLTFGVSRFLLQRERYGDDSELLPKKWQTKIIFSFIFSFAGWWTSVYLLVLTISNLIK
jgi:hypothetical protein